MVWDRFIFENRPTFRGWPTRKSRFIHRLGYLYLSGNQQNLVGIQKLLTIFLAYCPLLKKIGRSKRRVFCSQRCFVAVIVGKL